MPEITYIPLDRLRVGRVNVRIDVGDLSSLVDSIKKHGILEPLIVRKIDCIYEVICERERYEATRQTG